jgi:hypothetical protein
MAKYKVEVDKCSSVTINGDEYPLLITYLRKNTPIKDPATSKERGRPFGVVVSIGRDKIGWSICYNRFDTWSREEAIKRAAGRAMNGYEFWVGKFDNYTTSRGRHIGPIETSGLPKLNAVLKGMVEMKERARNYFKQ